MSERLTREMREELEEKIRRYTENNEGDNQNKNMTQDTLKIGPRTDITVPGEKEASELVEYHQKEWERITKGINLRDLYGTKKMREDAVFHYNQLQRLKPYGRSLFLDDDETLIHVVEPYSFIEESREATYKTELAAKGLPTVNIEDVYSEEAEGYYEAIKIEIGELRELMRERIKFAGIPTAWDDELFKAYERCALALRVIGELSGVIPQRLVDDYQRLLLEKEVK